MSKKWKYAVAFIAGTFLGGYVLSAVGGVLGRK